MTRRIAIAAAATGMALSLTAASQALPRALQAGQPGQWEISDPSHDMKTQRRCVRDLSALAQVEHRGRQCTRVTIDDQPGKATIHYTCTGGGFGRTTLERITPRNYRIDTQGIAGGLPFHYSLNARRVGNCGS